MLMSCFVCVCMRGVGTVENMGGLKLIIHKWCVKSNTEKSLHALQKIFEPFTEANLKPYCWLR